MKLAAADLEMIKIIHATNRRLDQILELYFQGMEESGNKSLDASLDEDLENIEANYFHAGGVFLIAIDDKQTVVGMGALRCIDQGIYEIKRMYVASRHRRKGIAESLLTALLEFAVCQHAKEVLLDTAVTQFAAQALYEKFGFQQCGTACIDGIESFMYRKTMQR